ncbi:MAG TPA: SAVMC3_10250 family protein [Chloroflexota bacterium]|nr:SAVMC3_10250 family protein [Chloroflexota bacterium]HUM69473.1 SAVMC3_10250 family protein [Chloroflexota bacterium]
MEKPSLKYYIYVSNSKIDMLYSQIPRTVRSQLEAEVKLNLRLLEVSFAKKQFDDSVYERLATVLEFLKKNNEIGHLSAPKDFFTGTMYLDWAQIHPGVVYFGGIYNDIALGLGGSMKYVLGYDLREVEKGISHTPWLVSYLLEELDQRLLKPNLGHKMTADEEENRIINSTNSWSADLSKRAIAKFEFVAKKMLFVGQNGKKVLLGTPIYVAEAF